jgi:hypothetical protein
MPKLKTASSLAIDFAWNSGKSTYQPVHQKEKMEEIKGICHELACSRNVPSLVIRRLQNSSHEFIQIKYTYTEITLAIIGRTAYSLVGSIIHTHVRL